MSRVGSVVSKVQEGSLYGLLFLLPFSNAVIEIAFGVLLLSWLFQRCYPATRADTIWLRPSLRPLALSLLIFLAACAASIAVSRDPVLSARSLISKWLEYLLFLVLAADIAYRKGVINRALLCLCGASMLVAVEAVVQEITGWGLLRRYPLSDYGRMTGPYHNPSDLATYLMVVIPILLMYALASGRWRRRWLIGLITILLLCLSRTESRGAWLGLAVGVVLIAWQPGRYRRYAAILGGGLVVAAVAFLYWAGHLSALYSSSQIGNVDRWDMWTAAWGMIKEHPVRGLGLNTFMANYLDFWVGGERMPRYAHNCYLQVTAETGFIGLGAFLWLLWALFARVGRAIRRAPDAEQALLVGWCAGLAAFVVQAAVDTNFYSLRQAALFWILSGAAVGLSMRATETPMR